MGWPKLWEHLTHHRFDYNKLEIRVEKMFLRCVRIASVIHNSYSDTHEYNENDVIHEFS